MILPSIDTPAFWALAAGAAGFAFMATVLAVTAWERFRK